MIDFILEKLEGVKTTGAAGPQAPSMKDVNPRRKYLMVEIQP